MPVSWDASAPSRGLMCPSRRLFVGYPAADQATTSCRCWPRPATPRSTTSPGLRNSGGLQPAPTPEGVPVAITSPGSKVMNSLRWLIRKATGKIMSAVLPVCRRLPLTSSHRSRRCGSATSSRVTSHGPIGAKLSELLPLTNWPPRSFWKRALRNVVDHGIPGHVIECARLGHIAGAHPDDHRQFHLPVGFQRAARDDDRIVGTAQRGDRLGEHQRLGSRRRTGFLSVASVIQADAENLADASHRRAEAHGCLDQRQRRWVDRRQPAEPLRIETVAAQIRHVAGKIADALLARRAGRAVPDRPDPTATASSWPPSYGP